MDTDHVDAFVSGFNDEDVVISYSYTASTTCLEETCNWLHVSAFPEDAEYGGGPLNHWLSDHAFSNTSVDITTAWCSFNTEPHNVLEKITDENGDGSIIDDLDKHLQDRGSDPLPEDARRELHEKDK